MIGGLDIQLSGAVTHCDVTSLLSFFQTAWPESVWKMGGCDDPVEVADIPIQCELELFLYKNQAACESWGELGLTYDNSSEMVTITSESDGISFVVDEKSSESWKLVRGFLVFLEGDRLRRGSPSPH